MATCLYELNMYQDAIEYCDNLLKNDPKNKQIHIIKAKSLALLHQFDLSIAILIQGGFEKEI